MKQQRGLAEMLQVETASFPPLVNESNSNTVEKNK